MKKLFILSLLSSSVILSVPAGTQKTPTIRERITAIPEKIKQSKAYATAKEHKASIGGAGLTLLGIYNLYRGCSDANTIFTNATSTEQVLKNAAAATALGVSVYRRNGLCLGLVGLGLLTYKIVTLHKETQKQRTPNTLDV